MKPTYRALAPLLFLLACAPGGPSPVAPPKPPDPAPAAAPLVAASSCVTAEIPDTTDANRSEDERGAKDKPDKPGDLCANADSNLERSMKAILAAPHPAPSGSVATARWDHRKKPERLDAVARRFALGKREVAALEKNGFVVPGWLGLGTYAVAFHEIYLAELPVFVSVDSILHAVYVGNDQVLARLEKRQLAPLLARTLSAMHCALPAAAAAYPPETARDLDVYLTVARALLDDSKTPPPPVFEGDEAEVKRLVDMARAAEGMAELDLFGRGRKIDFSAFTPRGHYATDGRTTPYFRAAMWLSRVELNLVSRSSRSSAASLVADPRETPREAVDALALSDLAARAGVMDAVRTMDRAWTIFGGKREDVTLGDLAELRAKAAIGSLTEPGVFERLKQEIGERFQRTTRIHYMPEGTTTLPAIATFLGPRIVADTTATGPLVEPRVPDRYVIGAADIAFALGQDRAKAYLAGEEKRFPDLPARLLEARALAHQPTAHEDLHGLWLRAVLALAERPAGALPSFMETEAFADKRLDSTLAAYAQIRHNAVLFAGQGYDQGGCAIPDGFVEPAPAVYEALAAYADRGAAVAAELDPGDASKVRAYFTTLGRILRVIDAIARDELAGRPLSEEELRFLSMVVEMTPGSSGGPPTYTGWYFDMFPSRYDALARADLVADYFTSGHDGVISYVGASMPHVGIFVVDIGGAPRVVAGPVSRAYEHHGPLATRLDDEGASQLPSVDRPWSTGYSIPRVKAPPFNLSLDVDSTGHARINADEKIGKVTVELLDHHRRTIESITREVGTGETIFPFKKGSEKRPIEAIHVNAAGDHRWGEVTWQGASLGE